jgi:glycosyltransferase involved in cell wall biosynthesis
MRILHFGKYWQKDGGIETHVRSLCSELAKNGFDVVNLVSSLDSKSSKFLFEGYNVVEAPTLGIYFSTSICPSMIAAAKKLQEEKPFELIHLHFPDPMSHLASMSLPASIPRIITWHSDIIKQKKLLQLYQPFQYRAISNAAAIVTATDAHFSSSQQIPKSFPQEKKWIIPYGMNYDRFELTPEISLRAKSIRKKLAGERFTVFSLGRHVEYKGFNVLLEALALTDAHLILGGEGPLTTLLKARTNALGITDRVSFTGRLTNDEAVDHYHACDIFCLPSITQNEAFGLVQLEAMSCEKPVICTNLNNGVNTVNPHMQTGLTVNANDPTELANAIKLLDYDRSLLRRLGENAKNRAHNHYSNKNNCKLHIDLYSKILRK